MENHEPQNIPMRTLSITAAGSLKSFIHSANVFRASTFCLIQLYLLRMYQWKKQEILALGEFEFWQDKDKKQ